MDRNTPRKEYCRELIGRQMLIANQPLGYWLAQFGRPAWSASVVQPHQYNKH